MPFPGYQYPTPPSIGKRSYFAKIIPEYEAVGNIILTFIRFNDSIKKMWILSILAYLVLIGVAVTAIMLSLQLYRKYRLKYLFYYLVSIIFSYAFGFLDIVAKYLTQGIFGCAATEVHVINTIDLAFSFIAVPFIAAAWYYLIHMLTAFTGKTFKPLYKIGFFAVQVVLIIVFAVLLKNYAAAKGTQSPELSETILFIFNTVNRGILIFVLLAVSISAKTITDPEMRKAARIFCTVYISVFVLHFLLVHVVTPGGYICRVYPAAEFLMHLPPLLYLRRFLDRYYKDHPLHPLKENDLPGFFNKYGITEREQEIIRLILEGKSNREIEDRLYISYTTVKTHIYNIYKKLNIKNRWQLINLMQNYQTKGEKRGERIS